MKGSGPTTLEPVGEGDGWASWIAYPEEGMQRASHALRGEDGWWLVDPVDADDLDDWLATLGDVAGVVVCFAQHSRDADAIAPRHDAPVRAPAGVAAAVESKVDAPVAAVDGELAGTGFRTRTVFDWPVWREAALYRSEDDTLLVPESVGTAPYFLAPDERLGVHPLVRVRPPRRALRDLEPERVLAGHGEPVTEHAGAALRDALAGARSRLPKLYARTARNALPI